MTPWSEKDPDRLWWEVEGSICKLLLDEDVAELTGLYGFIRNESQKERLGNYFGMDSKLIDVARSRSKNLPLDSGYAARIHLFSVIGAKDTKCKADEVCVGGHVEAKWWDQNNNGFSGLETRHRTCHKIKDIKTCDLDAGCTYSELGCKWHDVMKYHTGISGLDPKPRDLVRKSLFF